MSSSGRSSPTADRISALPDSVLCHILSFLPTKHAVATSILSKRWMPLCPSLLTLDFDEETFPSGYDFRHSVYSLLLSRDTTLSLHSFHLKLSGDSSVCDQHDINRFFNFATQRGIESLTLHIDLFGGITLPRCVLGATTLVVLKLRMLMVNDLPYVIFPSLKTLHLDCVTFMSYEYLEKLLCMCPILEDLQSEDLDIDDYKRFLPPGEVKMFPNLVRANISGPHIPFTSQINVDFLQDYMTNVDALDYDLPTFHNLIDLELTFDRHNCYRRWKWVLEVLGHCPKLQNLTILDLSDTASGEWEEPQTVAECLSSQLRTCSLATYRGDSCELQFAKYIMQNSKVLRSMTIQSSCEEPDPDIDTYEKLQMLMKLSQCQRGSATCKLLFKS